MGGMLQNREWFRQVMSRYPTGVTVVTGADRDGKPVGFTVNAVASVSLDPHLILVCADRDSASLPVLLERGSFAISVLRAEHVDLARRFSAEVPEERFQELKVTETHSGLPILEDALAWTSCRVWKTIEAGDHFILIGQVLECGIGPEGSPLVFFGSEFGTFVDLSTA